MKKILIVDDVEMNVDLLVQLLEDDYELLVANDGSKGLELAVSGSPDLILMDMSMPEMDGWEAAKQFKASESLNQIPIIGISSHAMSGDREKALQAGCDDYLTKPLDEEDLFTKLNTFLAKDE